MILPKHGFKGLTNSFFSRESLFHFFFFSFLFNLNGFSENHLWEKFLFFCVFSGEEYLNIWEIKVKYENVVISVMGYFIAIER